MIKNNEQIIELLEAGHVVGVPTDTVYGLATLVEFADEIYKLKKRSKKKKIVRLIHDVNLIGDIDDMTKSEMLKVCNEYWPGGNTLIFSQNNELVSYRIPSETNLLNLLKKINKPLLVSSANISGEKPAITKEEFVDIFKTTPLLEEKELCAKSGIPSNVYIIKNNIVEKVR